MHRRYPQAAPVLDSRFASDILGLGGSPLAVVLESKFGTIHDLMFARTGGRTSVNDDTDFSSTQLYELGHVLHDVLLRVFCVGTTGR